MTAQAGFPPRPAGGPLHLGTVRGYIAVVLWRSGRKEGFHFSRPVLHEKSMQGLTQLAPPGFKNGDQKHLTV